MTQQEAPRISHAAHLRIRLHAVPAVGGTTFGHRPKSRAQFECIDKVSCRLGKPSGRRASSFGRRPRRHRRRRREAKSDEDRGATGEDEDKWRVAKTKAHTAKTATPKAKAKISEERQRPRHLRRRLGRRLRSRRPEGKASESKRFESHAGNLVMGPMGRRGSDVIYQMM